MLFLLLSLFQGAVGFGIQLLRSAHDEVTAAETPDSISEETRELAAEWTTFVEGYQPSEEATSDELKQQRESYQSAFEWNRHESAEMITLVVPVFLLWDALVMMMLGMALFKNGVLHSTRSSGFYVGLTVIGFTVGLITNGYEIHRAVAADFEILAIFAQAQPTYHLGRLGMALGYVGLMVLIVKNGRFTWITERLASCGRMALTNYLTQSLLSALIFSGLGLSLVGELSRAQLYPVVIVIWIAQIAFSQWWLKSYTLGLLEWLWRALTYGTVPVMRR